MSKKNIDLSVSADLSTLWQNILGGDESAAQKLLQHPFATEDTPIGKAIRRAVGRHFQRNARHLWQKSKRVSGKSSRALSDRATEQFYKSVLSRHVHRLAPDSSSKPGTAQPSTEATNHEIAASHPHGFEAWPRKIFAALLIDKSKSFLDPQLPEFYELPFRILVFGRNPGVC